MNYGTLIDNQLHPAPRAFMLHMVTNHRTALQNALGWTDEQVEAVLAASVKEGY